MKTNQLDITNDKCPMTFVKTSIELSKIQKGDKLEVLLKKGEPLENVPRSVEEHGHKILEITHVKNDTYKIIIEK